MDEIGADGGITKGERMSECRSNLGDVRCGAYVSSEQPPIIQARAPAGTHDQLHVAALDVSA
jgi:hypothetical protein